MYLHFVVPNGLHSKVFCGPSALSEAIALAGDDHPIWSMTWDRAAEQGLLNPKTDHNFREVSMEVDVLYAMPGTQGKRRLL